MNKKKKVVLDTSVIVKWFVNETESDKANNLLQIVTRGKLSIVIPDMALAEITNAIRFTKVIACERCQMHIQNLFNIEPEIITLKEIIQKVVALVYATELTSYDASFIVIAEEMHIPLITADYKHHRQEISKNILWLSTLDIHKLLR